MYINTRGTKAGTHTERLLSLFSAMLILRENSFFKRIFPQ